jgi:hypothetical protein
MPSLRKLPLVDPVATCMMTEYTRMSSKGQLVRGRGNALYAWDPAPVLQLEKARRVLDARRAQLALRVLDGRLGLGRGVHVLGEDGARQVAPQSPALIRLLLVLGRDPFRRDVAAVLLRVEQRAFLAGLFFF